MVEWEEQRVISRDSRDVHKVQRTAVKKSQSSELDGFGSGNNVMYKVIENPGLAVLDILWIY